MGVLNVTPDSFSDGGSFLSPDLAVARGMQLFEEGADIVDVGGESTRPADAARVPAADERRRVVPVIEGLRATRVWPSLDRYDEGRGRPSGPGCRRGPRQRRERFLLRPSHGGPGRRTGRPRRRHAPSWRLRKHASRPTLRRRSRRGGGGARGSPPPGRARRSGAQPAPGGPRDRLRQEGGPQPARSSDVSPPSGRWTAPSSSVLRGRASSATSWTFRSRSASWARLRPSPRRSSGEPTSCGSMTWVPSPRSRVFATR